jgi:hypothetical protein
MAKPRRKPNHPGLVVLRQTRGNQWEYLGEVTRVRGLTARAARTAAVMALTQGRAKPGEIYAAVLRSEWRVSLDWASPPGG